MSLTVTIHAAVSQVSLRTVYAFGLKLLKRDGNRELAMPLAKSEAMSYF